MCLYAASTTFCDSVPAGKASTWAEGYSHRLSNPRGRLCHQRHGPGPGPSRAARLGPQRDSLAPSVLQGQTREFRRPSAKAWRLPRSLAGCLGDSQPEGAARPLPASPLPRPLPSGRSRPAPAPAAREAPRDRPARPIRFGGRLAQRIQTAVRPLVLPGGGGCGGRRPPPSPAGGGAAPGAMESRPAAPAPYRATKLVRTPRRALFFGLARGGFAGREEEEEEEGRLLPQRPGLCLRGKAQI